MILVFVFLNIINAEIKVYDKNNQNLGVLIKMRFYGAMKLNIPSLRAVLYDAQVQSNVCSGYTVQSDTDD